MLVKVGEDNEVSKSDYSSSNKTNTKYSIKDDNIVENKV